MSFILFLFPGRLGITFQFNSFQHYLEIKHSLFNLDQTQLFVYNYYYIKVSNQNIQTDQR